MTTPEQSDEIKDSDMNTFYDIGKRDMLANLFMEIRMSSVEETLQRWAEMLPDNPHTKHYLKK